MTYPVRYEITYPERSARWKLVFWRFFSSVPHFFVLAALVVSLVVVIPIGWAGTLVSGRFPRSLHRYAGGVLRWAARVLAYILSLTDEFPPFSLSADAAPAGKHAATKSAAVGVLMIGALIGLVVAFVALVGQEVTREVSYQRLLIGSAPAEERSATVGSGTVRLTAVTDPADAVYAPLLQPDAGYHFVEFELVIENKRGPEKDLVIPISTSHFSLRDTTGATHAPDLAIVGNKPAPADIASLGAAAVRLVFQVPLGAAPSELRYDVLNYIDFPRVGETIVYQFK